MKQDFDLFFKTITEDFLHVLPRLALAVIILFFGYLIGRFAKRMISRFILYLNKNLNLSLQNSTLNVDLKNSAKFISSAFFWLIFIFTFLISVQILQLEFLRIWFDKIVNYLPNILAAIIIVFVGIISGRLLGDLIQSAALRTGLSNGKFLGKAVRYLILFVAIVIAVDQVGVHITFLSNLFIVILAVLLLGASLAFALGAQTSISNILGSHYVRKIYQPGMKIKIGETEGTIIKLTDHAVSIETKLGVVVIPAKEFNETSVLIIKDQSI